MSDQLIEHQEIFWSLFTVDLDAILAVQPPDTWESFQLYQLLNDYLSNDGEYSVVTAKVSQFRKKTTTKQNLGRSVYHIINGSLQGFFFSKPTKALLPYFFMYELIPAVR